jgi:hypothetical protein
LIAINIAFIAQMLLFPRVFTKMQKLGPLYTSGQRVEDDRYVQQPSLAFALKHERVKQLDEQLCTAKNKVAAIEMQLKKEKSELQLLCKHADMFEEDDGDYHRKTHWFRCKDCNMTEAPY